MRLPVVVFEGIRQVVFLMAFNQPGSSLGMGLFAFETKWSGVGYGRVLSHSVPKYL